MEERHFAKPLYNYTFRKSLLFAACCLAILLLLNMTIVPCWLEIHVALLDSEGVY